MYELIAVPISTYLSTLFPLGIGFVYVPSYPHTMQNTPSTCIEPEAILCRPSGWVLNPKSQEQLRELLKDVAPGHYALIREVRGKYGKGSGTPEEFSEKRLLIISPNEKEAIESYLRETPSFPERWKADHSIWIGEYPCCSKGDGDALLGWQIESVSFSFKEIKKAK